MLKPVFDAPIDSSQDIVKMDRVSSRSINIIYIEYSWIEREREREREREIAITMY